MVPTTPASSVKSSPAATHLPPSNEILRRRLRPHSRPSLVLYKAEKAHLRDAQKKVGGAMVPSGTVLLKFSRLIEQKGQRGRLRPVFFELDDHDDAGKNGE